MLQSLTNESLADQLLRISREPELRRMIYERLGEYCHQCRNRLNSLKLSLYLVMRQSPESVEERWEPIDRQYQELERRIEQIQTLCRPLSLTKVKLGLDLLIDDRRENWVRLMAVAGKSLEFSRPSERAIAGFDVERLGHCLDALVAWRAGQAESGSLARIRWWADSGYVHLVWEESGLPSQSSSESASPDEGTWTLPFLVRMILAHEGDFQVQTAPNFRVEISWPT